MPRLALTCLAAIAAAGALGAADLAAAEPNDTVFVEPAFASTAVGASQAPAGPAAPSADDLRNLASARASAAGASQFAGSLNVGGATVAIPHGQIPGVSSSSVFGPGGALVSGTAVTGGPLAGASFGLGVSTSLAGGAPAAFSLGTPSPATGALPLPTPGASRP